MRKERQYFLALLLGNVSLYCKTDLYVPVYNPSSEKSKPILNLKHDQELVLSKVGSKNIKNCILELFEKNRASIPIRTIRGSQWLKRDRNKVENNFIHCILVLLWDEGKGKLTDLIWTINCPVGFDQTIKAGFLDAYM